MIGQITLKPYIAFVLFALFLCYSFNMFTLMLPLVQQVVLELCEDCGRITLKMMSRIKYNIDHFDGKNNFSI